MNKVMNFGDSSHKTVEMRDCFCSSGAKMAPLSWNRVNIQIRCSYQADIWIMILKYVYAWPLLSPSKTNVLWQEFCPRSSSSHYYWMYLCVTESKAKAKNFPQWRRNIPEDTYTLILQIVFKWIFKTQLHRSTIKL